MPQYFRGALRLKTRDFIAGVVASSRGRFSIFSCLMPARASLFPFLVPIHFFIIFFLTWREHLPAIVVANVYVARVRVRFEPVCGLLSPPEKSGIELLILECTSHNNLYPVHITERELFSLFSRTFFNDAIREVWLGLAF